MFPRATTDQSILAIELREFSCPGSILICSPYIWICVRFSHAGLEVLLLAIYDVLLRKDIKQESTRIIYHVNAKMYQVCQKIHNSFTCRLCDY